MAVTRPHIIHPRLAICSRSAILPAFLAVLALAAAPLGGQGPNPSSATNPYFGSITLHPATEDTSSSRWTMPSPVGLKNNLGLKEAESGERVLPGREE